MTKNVRVENADTSDYKVLVQVWHKGAEGFPDTLEREVLLAYPTQMEALGIHSHRYLVIKELESA